MVKFIGNDLIGVAPDPVTGATPSETERFREVVANAVLYEQLGFDGFSVGERHHVPFLSSAPPVVLSYIAAKTSKIRLFTGVTLLSALDPVRVAEDYATLDHLSGGRIELVIDKGNGPEQTELFGVPREQAWTTLEENYRLLRRLWTQEKVSWAPPGGKPTIRRVPLAEVTTHPRPLQKPPRIWHGSATHEGSVELAAEFGDPIFSANVSNAVDRYAELVRHYRKRWADLGRDPADAVVGAGTAGLYTARTSQQAIATFRPIYESLASVLRTSNHSLPGTSTIWDSYETFLERSSALVGSPQQVIDKVHRYYAALGQTVLTAGGHERGLTRPQFIDSLELFQSDVAPELRRSIPDPPWPDPIGPGPPA
jgi:alkanesulfonate monooxygenase SsuD/methylene tetrahydromethanopterin reductase-like flavin-dependent oxidoreductase (luciferase family)